MLGPLLAALMSGVGTAINAGNQSQANAVNWRAVMEQIRANREREELAEADRSDAYGNKLEYNEGSGWEYDLTPLTSAILSGEQQEMLRSLREDAPRNRAAAERMDERSILASDQFEDVFNDYKYRPRKNEAQYIDDATTLALGARQRGLSEAANDFAQQLLRTGNTSNVGKVYREAGDQYARTLEEALIGAKQQGKQNYRADENADLANMTGELSFLRGIADKTTTMPIMPNDFNDDLTGRSDQALQALTSVLGQNSQMLSSVLGRYAQGVGTPLDVSGIANALAKLQMPDASPATGSGYPNSTDDPWQGLRTEVL